MNTGKFIKIFLITSFVVIISGMSALFVLYYNGNVSQENTVKGTSEEMEPLNNSNDAETYSVMMESAESVPTQETVREETESTETEEKPEPITFLFAGDILFDDSYAVMSKLRGRGGEIEKAFSEDTLEEMREADFFMLNNEFTYTKRGAPTEGKAYTFRSKPENVKYLTQMGVDLVSLANNHAYDYGEVSLLDTMDTLREEGIPYVGAGKNLEEASAPYVLEKNGAIISVISATQIERLGSPDTRGAKENSPGVFRCFQEKEILDVVREEKERADFVIVYVHWGTESTIEIDWAQKELAGELADAGVDLIIGDHPHVLQPLGEVKGVPIIYSLGNYWFNSRAGDTCLVKVVIEKDEMLSFQFIPARQENCYTGLLDGAEKERVLNYMRKISPGVEIDEEGMVSF